MTQEIHQRTDEGFSGVDGDLQDEMGRYSAERRLALGRSKVTSERGILLSISGGGEIGKGKQAR